MKAIKIFFISNLGWLFLTLLYITYRKEYIKADSVADNFMDQKYILAFWHNRQLAMPLIHKHYKNKVHKLFVLISAHTDGRIIANTVKKMGIDSIAGSSTRGGRRALRNLIEEVNQGNAAAITPDGPKGPLYRVKNGVVKLAQETGAPIYPVTYIANKFWEFKSWDKMILPKPFAKLTFYVADAFYVDQNISEEEFNKKAAKLESVLNKQIA